MKQIIACFVFAFIIALPANAAKMVIQRSSNEQIMQTALSPNGKYLVCGLYNTGIELWDAKSGTFIKSFPDSFIHSINSMNETPLMWSEDGKVLFTSVRKGAPTKKNPYTNEYSVRMREMPSGKIIRTFPNLRPPLWTDGKILRVTDGKSIRTWRVFDGALIYGHLLQLPTTAKKASAPDKYANMFAFSRNGKYLGYGGGLGDASMCVWDTSTGKLLHQINDEFSARGKPAISNDGRYLVAQGEDPEWTPPPPECNTEACYSHSLKLHLWDLKEKKIIRTWKGFDSGAYHFFIKFFNDNKHFIANNRIFDIASGMARPLQVDYLSTHSETLSFNDQFIAGEFKQKPIVLSALTGKVVQKMPGEMKGGIPVALSPDQRFLANGLTLQIWDLSNASLLQTRLNHPPQGYRIYWENNSSLYCEGIGGANWIQIDTGNKTYFETKQFIPQRDNEGISRGNEIFASPNGKYAAGYIWAKHDLYIWDVASGEKLTTISSKDISPSAADSVIHWLPDNVHFVVGTFPSLGIWNALTGKLDRLLETPAFPPPDHKTDRRSLIKFEAISPDGKFLAGTNARGRNLGIGIWNIQTGKLVRMIPKDPLLTNILFGMPPYSNYSNPHITFTEDNSLKITVKLPSGNHQRIINWRSEHNVLLNEESSHSKKILAVGGNSSIEIYNASNGKLLAHLASGDKTDWLIWTPQGYFSAPDHGRKRVRWEEDGKMIQLDSPRDKELRVKFYNPQMVTKLIAE